MFHIDGKLFAVMSRFCDLVVLNIVFIFCCIPLITIGASVTALYGVTKKMAAKKEGYIIREFFRQMKENFKQSTVMWCILCTVGIVLFVDLYIGNLIQNGMGQTLYRGLILLGFVMAILVLIYAMSLQSTFENTVKNTLKNAILISLAHFPWSVLIAIIALSPLLSLIFWNQYFSMELLAILLVWFSGGAYINSFILNRIYKKYMGK